MSQPAAPTGQIAPPLVVNAQYVKDLSFEVPGAPQIYSTLRNPPQVAVNLDVQVKRLTEEQLVFEVTLVARVEATKPAEPGTGGALNGNEGPSIVFLAELSYAGDIHSQRRSGESDRTRSGCRGPAPSLPLRPQHPGRCHA